MAGKRTSSFIQMYTLFGIPNPIKSFSVGCNLLFSSYLIILLFYYSIIYFKFISTFISASDAEAEAEAPEAVDL
jgi:hypothetical protein